MKKIQVIVTNVAKKDGGTFKAFKCLNKSGKKMDLKFTRDCKNVPSESCFIYVLEENANVDNTKLYPCTWVKQIERIEELTSADSLDQYFESVEE